MWACVMQIKETNRTIRLLGSRYDRKAKKCRQFTIFTFPSSCTELPDEAFEYLNETEKIQLLSWHSCRVREKDDIRMLAAIDDSGSMLSLLADAISGKNPQKDKVVEIFKGMRLIRKALRKKGFIESRARKPQPK